VTLDFSIIVATYARPDELRACLQSLQNLDPDGPSHETVVVDDGSPQPVDTQALPGPLQLLRQPNAGAGAARNRGAQSACGRRLVFLDDDCRVPRDWLVNLDRACRAHPNAMIGGRTRNALEDNLYSAASQFLVDQLYSALNAGRARFFTANNLCVGS